MISLTILNGDKIISDAEMKVAEADEIESRDLSHHVRMDDKRFKLLAEALNTIYAATRQNTINTVIILIIGAYLVLVSPPAQTLAGVVGL